MSDISEISTSSTTVRSCTDSSNDIDSSNDNKKVQYGESTNIKESDFDEFRKKWNELLKQQKYKEAEKLCHQSLENSSTFAGYLHSCLGDLYLKHLNDGTFDFNHILEYYVLPIRLCTSNSNSHYNLANFLLQQAMQHLFRAKELNPNHKKLKDFDDDDDSEYLPHRVDPCCYEIKTGKIHIYEYDDQKWKYGIHSDNKYEIREVKGNINHLIINGYISNKFNKYFDENNMFYANISEINELVILFCGNYLYQSIISKPIISIKSIAAFCEYVTINVKYDANIIEHRMLYKSQDESRWNIINITDIGRDITVETKRLEPYTDYLIYVESTMSNKCVTTSNILNFKTKHAHMSLRDALKLMPGDKIDHQPQDGEAFYYASIQEKDGTSLHIHYADAFSETQSFVNKNSCQLKCICGRFLQKMRTESAYYGSGVRCNICRASVYDSFVYHCVAGKKLQHIYGYDVCINCAQQQVFYVDVWSDVKKEIHRFAKPGSISRREAHRLLKLKKGDYILINPTQKHFGWKWGIIQKFDTEFDKNAKRGQIQVAYQYNDDTYTYWSHLDNKYEIREFEDNINHLIINRYILDELTNISYEINELVILFCGNYLHKSIISKPIINIKSIGTFCESITINIENNYDDIIHRKLLYKKTKSVTFNEIEININNKEVEINELEPNTDYLIYVDSIHTSNLYETTSNILTFATKNVHMTLEYALKLKPKDKIDYQRIEGRFYGATILEKHDTNLKIHYNGYSDKYDVWSDVKKEIHRFAKYGSISRRLANRFMELQKGDYIYINPTLQHFGWKCGKIRKLDTKSGRIQVMYDNTQKLYWSHLDNKYEIKQFKYNINHLIIDGWIRLFMDMYIVSNDINQIVILFCGDNLYKQLELTPIIDIKSILPQSVTINITKNDPNNDNYTILYKVNDMLTERIKTDEINDSDTSSEKAKELKQQNYGNDDDSLLEYYYNWNVIDIKKLKKEHLDYKIEGLKSGTNYAICVVSKSRKKDYDYPISSKTIYFKTEYTIQQSDNLIFDGYMRHFIQNTSNDNYFFISPYLFMMILNDICRITKLFCGDRIGLKPIISVQSVFKDDEKEHVETDESELSDLSNPTYSSGTYSNDEY